MSEQLNSSSSVRTLICGTAYYMAPEVFDEHTGLESDIWSLGITAIELAEGKHPFESHSVMRVMKRISTEPPPSLSSSHWSADFVDFVKQCLIKDPTARPSASTLLKVLFLLLCDHSIRSLRTLWSVLRTVGALLFSASLRSAETASLLPLCLLPIWWWRRLLARSQ